MQSEGEGRVTRAASASAAAKKNRVPHAGNRDPIMVPFPEISPFACYLSLDPQGSIHYERLAAGAFSERSDVAAELY